MALNPRTDKIVGAIDLKHPIVDELRAAMNIIKHRVPEHIIDRNVGSLPANQYPYISTVVENNVKKRRHTRKNKRQ
jgi:hypothetical protein